MRLTQEDGGFIFGSFGQFNAKEPVEKLKLDIIVVNIKRIAFTLWSFFTTLVQQRLYYNSCDFTPHHSKIFIICAILLNI